MLLPGTVREQPLGCGLLSVQMLCMCVHTHTHEAEIRLQHHTCSYTTGRRKNTSFPGAKEEHPPPPFIPAQLHHAANSLRAFTLRALDIAAKA